MDILIPGLILRMVYPSDHVRASSSLIVGLIIFSTILSLSLLVSLVNDLLLEGSGLRETKRNLVGSELVVAVDDGIESILHLGNIEGVEQNNLLLSAISLHAEGSLSDV